MGRVASRDTGSHRGGVVATRQRREMMLPAKGRRGPPGATGAAGGGEGPPPEPPESDSINPVASSHPVPGASPQQPPKAAAPTLSGNQGPLGRSVQA